MNDRISHKLARLHELAPMLECMNLLTAAILFQYKHKYLYLYHTIDLLIPQYLITPKKTMLALNNVAL